MEILTSLNGSGRQSSVLINRSPSPSCDASPVSLRKCAFTTNQTQSTLQKLAQEHEQDGNVNTDDIRQCDVDPGRLQPSEFTANKFQPNDALIAVQLHEADNALDLRNSPCTETVVRDNVSEIEHIREPLLPDDLIDIEMFLMADKAECFRKTCLLDTGTGSVSDCSHSPTAADIVESRLKGASQRTLNQTPANEFVKLLGLLKMPSQQNGLCILESFHACTGIPVAKLKQIILDDFNLNSDTYVNRFGLKREEMNEYLTSGKYDSNTVDSVLDILVKTTGRTLYIVSDEIEEGTSKTLLIKISPSGTCEAGIPSEPVFFLKTCAHYDALFDLG